MWVYRLGAEKAKRMLLTGDLVTGKEAQAMGLIYKAVPMADLDAGTFSNLREHRVTIPSRSVLLFPFEEVDKLVERMASIPKNQLIMQKLVVNSGKYGCHQSPPA